MKGKFNAYVLWPLAKKFKNLIVDWSSARDFTVGILIRIPIGEADEVPYFFITSHL